MVSAMDAPVALPTAADVDEAARRLAGVALRTPLLTSAALDAMTGGRIFLKAETLQRTGSFKFRGAYNKLAAIPPERRAGGVVAFSSGNHAQGVAAAARLLGMRCVIVMPHDAPRAKRERTVASDEEVTAAVAFAFAELKLVVEPGGAVALAALMTGKVDVNNKIGVAILSGGNVDPEVFSRLVA